MTGKLSLKKEIPLFKTKIFIFHFHKLTLEGRGGVDSEIGGVKSVIRICLDRERLKV